MDRVKKEDPDILCLQEVKAFETQIPAELRYFLQDYNYIWHAGQRPGYSGVATFGRSHWMYIKWDLILLR